MQRISRRMALLACVMSFAAVGCKETPPTNADEVLDYVRNASVGAQVRRLDPKAQAYVDGVYKAVRAFEGMMDVAGTMQDPSSFWEMDSKNWRDMSKVEELLESITKWEGGAAEREELASKIMPAILDEPTLPGGIETRDGPLNRAVRQYLDLDGIDALEQYATPSSVVDLAKKYRSLLEFCQKNAASLDPKTEGLDFTSDDLDQKATQLWNDIHSSIEKSYDLEALNASLAEQKALSKQFVEEKQAIRKEGLDDPERFRAYRSLELRVFYHDQRAKSIEGKIRTAKSRLEDHPDSR